MSVLGTVSSVRCHVVTPAFASTSKSATCSPVRRYASGRNMDRVASAQKAAAKKAAKAENAASKASSSTKNVKRIGTFLPLPVSMLKHPLFKVEDREKNELRLPVFGADTLSKSSVGQVMQFAKAKETHMRAYGLPKNMLLDFRVVSKPCSVVREVTLSVAEKLLAAEGSSSSQTRAVFTGAQGCGKSYALLQSVEYCASRHWIILYVPRALKTVNSSSAYVYDPRTRTFVQPEFSFQLLQRFLTVNAAALESLKTSKEFVSPRRTLPVGTPLVELISIGTRDKTQAAVVLEALVEEVSRQTTYPVLLAIDDFQSLYCNTFYRNPRNGFVKSWHLSVPRLLLEFASGKRSFERGAVLGAISTTHSDFQTPLELQEALGLPIDHPVSPYQRRQPELVQYSEGLQNIPVPRALEVGEAAALFETLSKDGAMHTMPTDETFLSLYTSTSGNPRDFVWKGVLGSFGV